MKNSTNRDGIEKLNEYTLGETIDLLTEMDWTFLVDLYKCRCMKKDYMIDIYFNESPEQFYKHYAVSDELTQKQLEEKNKKRLSDKMDRMIRKLKSRGLIETSSMVPDSLSKPNHVRKTLRGISWLYLSFRGLRIVEKRLDIPDEAKLSKNEVDMERVKKDHFWEIAKLYLNLKYDIFKDLKQFDHWDWYPSETIAADNETMIVRPDAILRLEDQFFFIELDRSTEPVYRSPLQSDQVSIHNKLKRYFDVMRLSTNEYIREGYIAIVIPTARFETRLSNIQSAADKIFQKSPRVIVSKNMEDILIRFSDMKKQP
ncbi:replication-relaxation family protein [Paenibacillus farraposensis]|uniref:Replication-relaxation family protein n=1 Tax=Paenibacillus farraposensis TaxID=2807095 RepID=A0ABW4DIN7_9BACL|nr:replication-relaxation family protein [Paenibacillus farraposensis]MCC3379298.1 replication-relaxation family protein [Paenibacillus farraposensis]